MFKKSGILGLLLALVMAVMLLGSPVLAQDGPDAPPTDVPPGPDQPPAEPPIEPPAPEPPVDEPPVIDVPPVNGAPPVISLDGSAPVIVNAGVPGQYQALAAEVQRAGSVRVLVGLNMAFTPPGNLTAGQAIQQRASIQQAQSALLTELAGTNFSVNTAYWAIPYIALTIDEQALNVLMRSGAVSVINQDKLNKFVLDDSTVLTGAVHVQDSGFSGSGETVAVLDTGVDDDHPFIQDKLVAEACFNTSGWNFGYYSESTCPGSTDAEYGMDTADPARCVALVPDGTIEEEGCSHGTHVSGIAAGKDPGGLNFNGMAPEANLIGVNVFSYFPDFEDVFAWDSDIVEGLQFVYDQVGAPGVGNIAAVNLSLGGGRYFDQTTCDWDNMATKAMIDTLKSVGVATIIASGNDGFKDSMGSPGCISSAVSVGATSKQDRVANFSNSVYFLSLLAPGRAINSSVLYAPYYEAWGGTSMATPHVTGAWALYRDAVPGASVGEVLAALQSTGVPIVDSNGLVKPRIQVDAALGILPPVTPTPGATVGDDFDTPLLIAATPYDSGALDPTTFTTYFDDPIPSCGWGIRTAIPSIWFRYDATANGLLDLDASLSVFSDTLLGVFTGARGALTEIACNDDVDPNGGVYRSRIVLPVTAGTTYYVLLGGSSTTATTALELTADIVTAPANDDIANATAITILPWDEDVDLFEASWDPLTDPWPSCNADAFTLGPTIWYTYTPGTTQVVNLNAGYNFYDPIIGVYTGAPGSLVERACAFYGLDYSVPAAGLKDGIQPRVIPDGVNVVRQGEDFKVPMVAGETYYIMVSGYNGSRGLVNVHVAIDSFTTVANDEYAGATVITVPYSDSTLVLDNATTGENDPQASCNPYTFEKTVWYTFTPDAPGRYVFDAAPSSDPPGPNPPMVTMALYTGDDVAGFSEVACATGATMDLGFGPASLLAEGHQTRNTGRIRMATPLDAGETYTLVIGSYYSDQGDNTVFPLGTLTLTVDAAPFAPVAYEDFDGALEIVDPLPFFDEVLDTSAALAFLDDPAVGCAPYVGHTLWYKYTPASNVQVRLDTLGSDYDTVVAVYTGARGALNQVACGDEIVDPQGNYVSSQTLLDVNMQTAITYYIMVGGYRNDWGLLNFNAQLIPAPAATPLPAGAKPVPLTPANKSYTNYPWGVNISWQPVTGAAAYDLQVSDKSNFSNLWLDVTVQTSNRVLGMHLPEGKYYWRVRVSPAGSWSKRFEFTVDFNGPGQVPVLQSPKPLAGVPDNTPKFSWKKVKDAANYRLVITDNYYDAMCPDAESGNCSVPNPGETFDVWGGTYYDSWLGSSKTSYTLLDIEALYGTGTYFWSIQAQDKAGNWGPVSAPQAFYLINLKSPKNEQVYKTKATKAVTLQWNKMVNVKGYQIQVSDTVLFEDLLVDQWTTQTKFKTAALPHGIYYWRVNPDTPFGIEESTVIWKFIVAPTIPGSVKLVSPSNKAVLTTNLPVLGWQALDPAKYGYVTYDIQVDIDKKFSDPLVVSGVGDTSQTLPAMAPGTYYWRVRGVNEYGAPGKWSSAWQFVVP